MRTEVLQIHLFSSKITMTGTKTRSSYKRKRKGKRFSGRQRYEGENRDLIRDENMSIDDPACEPQHTDDEYDGSNPQNVIGTSRKKMRCESRNDSSDNDSEENVHEYRLISLGCLSNVVSNIQHVCGEGKNLSYVFLVINCFLSLKTVLI